MKIPATEILAGQWNRFFFSYTSMDVPALSSFTIELGFEGAPAGQAVLIDGVQLEKALTLPDGRKSAEPTPWVHEKGIVSPNSERNIEDGKGYFTW